MPAADVLALISAAVIALRSAVRAPVRQGKACLRGREPGGAPGPAGVVRGAGCKHRQQQADVLLFRTGERREEKM